MLIGIHHYSPVLGSLVLWPRAARFNKRPPSQGEHNSDLNIRPQKGGFISKIFANFFLLPGAAGGQSV